MFNLNGIAMAMIMRASVSTGMARSMGAYSVTTARPSTLATTGIDMGARASGAIVPSPCSVECALVAIPFIRDCTPLLHMQPAKIAKLNQFALRTCAGQDLTTLVEYGADLFEKGCSIEFGVGASPSPPAWRNGRWCWWMT